MAGAFGTRYDVPMADTPGVVFDDAAVPAGGRKVGYAVLILLNGVFLFVANNLLTWGWPPWLTDDFEAVLPTLDLAIVVTMIANVVYLAYDPPRVRAGGDIVTTALSLVVGIRMWQVFPFDFTGYAGSWDTLVRWVIGFGIAATAIALVVDVGRLARLALGSERGRIR